MPLVTRGFTGIVRALLLSAPYIVRLVILVGDKLGWSKKKKNQKEPEDNKQKKKKSNLHQKNKHNNPGKKQTSNEKE